MAGRAPAPDRIDIVPGFEFRSEKAAYRVTRELGEGGFGSVYEVESGGQRYALKITKMWNFLPQERQEYAKRFRQEYDHSKMFSSPYVVRSHDFYHVGGNPYMVMDLCENGSLRDWVGERLPQDKIRNVTFGVLKGLETLHDNGIIHRDIKPENILFNGINQPCLADFGISASVKKRHTITNFRGHAKQVFATGTYSPPEQSDPTKAFKVMGNTNDIYAFGVVLYELLTSGRLPFGDFEAYMQDMMAYEKRKKDGKWDRQALEASGADAVWVEIVDRCLKPGASERYQYANNILDRLGLQGGVEFKKKVEVLPHHEWILKVMNGEEIGREYNLSNLLKIQGKKLLTLGWYNPDDPFTNDIGVQELFTTYISGYHATLEYNSAINYFFIRDGQWREKNGLAGWYKSTNGVLVNSLPISEAGAKLEPEDIITVGDTTLRIEVKDKSN